MNMIRYALTLAALTAMATACDRSPTENQEGSIIGTWELSRSQYANDIGEIWVFSEDGSFFNFSDVYTDCFPLSGTWETNNNDLTFSLNTSDDGKQSIVFNGKYKVKGETLTVQGLKTKKETVWKKVEIKINVESCLSHNDDVLDTP